MLGGSRIAADKTAYAHRKSGIMVNVVRAVENDESAARRWTVELAEALYQGDDGAYVNFFGPADAHLIQAAYPGTRWRGCGGSRPPTIQRTSSPTTTTSPLSQVLARDAGVLDL
ncbi:MAG TPA: hypothetical protein VFY56_12745 [Propionibacteriaceae bacterium]|nr:hypothetical protein [Propionibacteriaceae bacterium]